MSLSEKSRAAMFDYFGKATPLGEEVTSEMIANIDTPDLNDLVTKDHLDSRIMEVRLELHTEISGLRGEMTSEFSGLRGEMTEGIGGLRGEMTSGFAEVRSELHAQLLWMIGTMVTLFGMLAGLIVALH